MGVASGGKAWGWITSSTPRAASALVALGPSWMPAPVSSVKWERSRISVAIPRRPRAMEAASPPMPPPAMSTRSPRLGMRRPASSRRCAWRGGRDVDAGRRIAFSRLERVVMHEQGRAIRADDVGLVAHVEIDVGGIVRRGGPPAPGFLDADPDPVDALVVHEMRYERLSHGRCSVSRSEMAASIVTLKPKR